MATARAQARFLLGAIALFAFISYLVVRPYLGAIALGVIFGYLLYGPYRKLEARLRRPRLAAGLMVALTLLLLVTPVAIGAAIFFEDLVALPGTLANVPVERHVARALSAVGADDVEAAAVVATVLENLQAIAADLVAASFFGVIEFFIGLFIFIFILFFALLQGAELVDFVRRATPLDDRRTQRLLRETGRAIDAIFRGEILVAIVQGVVAGVGWWLFGLPAPFIWGFVMMVLAILPWVGPALVMAPAGIYLLAQGEVVRGVLLLVYALAIVGLVDNFLRPIVIGKRGKIHIAIVAVGIVGGLALFGVVGIFLGPLVLALLRAFLIVWTEDTEIRVAS
jgi:predicted PurR-regulated permease PerM